MFYSSLLDSLRPVRQSAQLGMVAEIKLYLNKSHKRNSSEVHSILEHTWY